MLKNAGDSCRQDPLQQSLFCGEQNLTILYIFLTIILNVSIEFTAELWLFCSHASKRVTETQVECLITRPCQIHLKHPLQSARARDRQ